MNESLKRSDRLVTVFGGSGFLGRHVVRALAEQGWRILVATRRPDLAFHLQPLGGVGQIHAVQANLRYPDSIAAALRKADAVVNLVGILRPSGAQSFDAVHRLGARNLALAAREAGIESLVQVSAIGADPSSPSLYARSKAAGEQAVREAMPGAVILRPSVVFGPEDQFFNRFAAMARIMPALPLIGGGLSKLQPVYAGDVATVVALALDGKVEPGTTYELGGPEVRSLREIMAFILAVTERKRLLLPIPFGLAKLIGGATEIAMKLSFGLFPETFALTRDQVELLRRDNVVSAEASAEGRTLRGLGIAPESFETLVPTYLVRYRKFGQFTERSA
ncbi:MAG TPA: complex I NDUFA9 subunit family protein [Methylovirgula sp.]|nr:complex I NDUFA9 subunit family protein [Methylovirgula sp.]